MSSHKHDHAHDQTTSNIKLAFLINLAFSVIELVGGILTNSIAIMSDALHDFGDSVSLGLSWLFQKKAKKGATAKFSYGFRRLSVISATVNSLVLAVGSTIILTESVKRLFSPSDVDAHGMLILAIIGIAANGFAFFRTKGGKNINQKTVSLHLLEDVMGWLAVLVASIVMIFFDLPILDPLLSIGISVFIIINIIKNIRRIVNITLEGTPDGLDISGVKKALNGIKGVNSLHDLHIWSLDGEAHILTVHLVVPKCDTVNYQKIHTEARKVLKEFGIIHSTIEIDQTDTKDPDEVCVLGEK